MTVFPFIFARKEYKPLAESFKEAYRNISFEREAYDNEWDKEYLDGIREPFEFLHYLKKED